MYVIRKAQEHHRNVELHLYRKVCQLVCRSVVIELKSGKTSVFDTYYVCLRVGGGLGCGWGLDAPAHPSATIL